MCCVLSVVLLGMPEHAGAEVSLGLATTLVEQETPAEELSMVPVTVFNDGDVTLTVIASASDLLLDPRGRATPRQASEEDSSWSAASWIDVDTPEFTLDPGEETEVWVAIEPPAGAEPGTHRALVVFRGTPLSAGGDVVVRPNVALVMLATVPGDVVRAPTLELDFPRFVFFDPAADVVLGNRGSVHYFASGGVVWSRKGTRCGECVPELPEAGALVLPDEQRLVPVSWSEAPLLGVFDVTATFDTDDGRSLSARDRFVLVRWQLVAIVAAVLAVVGGLSYLGRRYRLVPRNAE